MSIIITRHATLLLMRHAIAMPAMMYCCFSPLRDDDYAMVFPPFAALLLLMPASYIAYRFDAFHTPCRLQPLLITLIC